MHITLDQVRDLFKRHGVRSTRQREMVYAALCQSCAHPTAEDLHQTVHAQDPGLSLATVYNTLEVLLDSRLCQRLNPRDGGPARFDADLSQHAHVATPDGRFIDVPEDLSRDLLSRLGPDLVHEIERRMGIRVDSVSLNLIARGAAPSQEPAGGDEATPNG